MTAAFRDSSGFVTGISVTSITVPVPAGVVDGDLMIAIINHGLETGTTVPAGWTHVAGSPHETLAGATNNFIVMTRIADSEPADYTWGRAFTFLPIGGVIIAFSDAVVDFVNIGGNALGHSVGSNPGEYLGTDIASEFYLTAVAITGEWYLASNSVILPTAGFTEREDVNFDGNGGHTQVQSGPATGPGAVSIALELSASVPIGAHSFLTMGIGNAPPIFTEIEIINLDPAGTDAIPQSSAISFDLVGPENFVTVGVSVRYRSDSNRYMVYELDGFIETYAPNSTVTGVGTAVVNFSLLEFKGWRDRVASITVFGIDDAGTLFSLEAIE